MKSALKGLGAVLAHWRSRSPSGKDGEGPVPTPTIAQLTRPLPRDVAIPPSMMSAAEQAVLFHLAQDAYTGRGLIVDAGIFLGASTCCFGEGLARNRAASRAVEMWSAPIVSFDLAIVNKTMQAFFDRHELAPLAEGESLAPLIGRNIAPVRALVDLRIGDIRETGLVDAPIEILFLDCLKQEPISRYAVEHYFTRLVPGSFVIQQDYLSDMLPFIKFHQEFFADHFEFVGEVASSAIFRSRVPITANEIAAWQQAITDPDLQIRLVESVQKRTTDPARIVLVALSAMRLIGSLKGLEAARTCLAAIKEAHAPFLNSAALPRRVRNAIHGAEVLCASQGTRRDFIDAQLISLGHTVPERPARSRAPSLGSQASRRP